MFLLQKELKELTGYSQGARQISWLEQNRIPYFRAKDGTPRVLIAHLEHKMASQKKRSSEPNEQALLRRMGIA